VAIAIGRDVVVQLLQGFQELKLEVRDLKLEVRDIKARLDRLELRVDKLEQRMDKLEERMDKLEGRMDRLEVRMDRLEASNAQILDYVKDIARMLVELTSIDRGHADLSTRVDVLERRVTALEQ
jgi:chromosome segregation ATPase